MIGPLQIALSIFWGQVTLMLLIFWFMISLYVACTTKDNISIFQYTTLQKLSHPSIMYLRDSTMLLVHNDVIKWKHFPRHWTFVREIHRSPVNSPYKGQWRGALMFSLICAWTNGSASNRDVGDLRRHRAHYDVNVMTCGCGGCSIVL